MVRTIECTFLPVASVTRTTWWLDPVSAIANTYSPGGSVITQLLVLGLGILIGALNLTFVRLPDCASTIWTAARQTRTAAAIRIIFISLPPREASPAGYCRD